MRQIALIFVLLAVLASAARAQSSLHMVDVMVENFKQNREELCAKAPIPTTCRTEFNLLIFGSSEVYAALGDMMVAISTENHVVEDAARRKFRALLTDLNKKMESLLRKYDK